MNVKALQRYSVTAGKLFLASTLQLFIASTLPAAPQTVYVNADGTIVNLTGPSAISDFKFNAGKLKICDSAGANCVAIDTAVAPLTAPEPAYSLFGNFTGSSAVPAFSASPILTSLGIIRSTAPGPTLTLTKTGVTRQSRLFGTTGNTFLTQNLSYTGTLWNLDDTALPGWGLQLNDGVYQIVHATAGTNPRTLTVPVSIDGSTNAVTFLGNITAPNFSGTNTGDQDLGGLVPNTRTVNGHALSSNVTVTAADAGAVASNSAITGATKTKITYDTKGLVTSGADATTADIADSTDKRYVSDAQRGKIDTAVQSLTVTSGNGVSGSFTSGATPALSLSLGAITPSSITITSANAADNIVLAKPGISRVTRLNSQQAGVAFLSQNNSYNGSVFSLDDIAKPGWLVQLNDNADLFTVTHFTAGTNPRSGTNLLTIDGATGTVTATGALAGSNLSGTNTGDQDLSGLVPNTRTVNGHALSSNVTVTAADAGAVAANSAITGATKTKITFDSKGLVTAGADASQNDISGLTTTSSPAFASITTTGPMMTQIGGTTTALTTAPATGAGLELLYITDTSLFGSTGAGFINSYDRTAAAFKPLKVQTAGINFNILAGAGGAIGPLTVTGAGINLGGTTDPTAGYIKTNGYIMRAASAPATPPTNDATLYADTSGRFSWKRSDGFIRKFDSTLTADRIYTLPDAAGNVVIDSAPQTLANKSIDAAQLTGTIPASVPRQGSFAGTNGGSFWIANTNTTGAQNIGVWTTATTGLFNVAERNFHFHAAGVSTINTTSTQSFTLKLGGVTIATWSEGNNITATATGVEWEVDGYFTVVSTGASGTVICHGTHTYKTVAGAGAATVGIDGNTAVSGAIDLTGTPALQLTVAYTVNGATPNVCTQHQFSGEVTN